MHAQPFSLGWKRRVPELKLALVVHDLPSHSTVTHRLRWAMKRHGGELHAGCLLGRQVPRVRLSASDALHRRGCGHHSYVSVGNKGWVVVMEWLALRKELRSHAHHRNRPRDGAVHSIRDHRHSLHPRAGSHAMGGCPRSLHHCAGVPVEAVVVSDASPPVVPA